MQVNSSNNLASYYTKTTDSSSSTGTTSSSTSSSSTSSTQTLDQDDFLTLLVKQMTSQDPLDPESNTDFIAQMAQFTALEQTKSMTSAINSMASNQSLANANSLIGKTVTLTSNDTTVSGEVSGVTVTDGTAQIVVNGNSYDVSSVTSVSNTTTTSTTE